MPSKSGLPSKSRSIAVPCAALFFEVLLFHRRVLFAGDRFPWDFRAVHLPLATFVADSFRRGEFPLWDPYTYCGNPIYANIQTALFYPPVFLATLASVWLGHLAWLLEASAVLQIFLAGVCMFALLRRMGASSASAWIAGTMYELGCFFASQAEHLGAIQGACWLPLAWLCVYELRSGLRIAWLAILSFALSMTVLAGLPQAAVAVFGSALLLAILVGPWRQALIAWAWALLLAAVQIIPTIELTRNSVAKYRAEWLGSGGGIKLGALASLVVPNYWNVFDLSKFHGPSDPTFLYLYSSVAGLILALVSLWRADRRSVVFGILTLGATIWMLGDSTPIGHTIFMALPVSIRIGIHPEFTMCVFSAGLAVMAGLGAERVPWRSAAGVVVAAELIFVSSSRPMNAAPPTPQPPELVAKLRTLTANNPPWRFDMTPATSLEWSSTAPVTGVPTANGCDPMALERVIQVRLSFSPGERWGTCFQVVNRESPIVRLVNDRYLLDGGEIREVANPMPRFFFVPRLEEASGLADASRRIHQADFDPAAAAVVENTKPAAGGGGSVLVLSYTAKRIELETHTSRPAFLVATDSYYPGWRATVDGRMTDVYATDVAFRGIQVPAGDHRIEMRFVPRFLPLSATISAAALLLAMTAALRGLM